MVAEQGRDSWLLTQELTGRSGWGVLHQHHSSLVPLFCFLPLLIFPHLIPLVSRRSHQQFVENNKILAAEVIFKKLL